MREDFDGNGIKQYAFWYNNMEEPKVEKLIWINTKILKIKEKNRLYFGRFFDWGY